MKEMIEIHTVVGNYVITSYSLCVGIAIFVTISLSLFLMSRDRMGIAKTLSLLLIMTMLFLLGSRLLYVLTHITYFSNSFEQAFKIEMAGFSIIGGLVLSTLGGWSYSKLVGISFWKLADSLAPGLCLGIMFARIGCFLNGCCFGIETNAPWAVHFPYDSLSFRYYLSRTGEKGAFSIFSLFRSPGIHPTQLYEAGGAFLAATVAVFLLRKKVVSGISALTAALLFVIIRFINHFFRAQVTMDENPKWLYPVFYLLLLSITIWMLRQRLLVNEKSKTK